MTYAFETPSSASSARDAAGHQPAEDGGFLRAQLAERLRMPAQDEHEPPETRRVERVSNAPETVVVDAFARRQLRISARVLAGIAA